MSHANKLEPPWLTIEHRSPVPDDLRAGIGEHLFGCDDCQTVCPFNPRARGAARDAVVDPRFLPDPRWRDVALGDLLALDDDGFVRLREGSPIGRATRSGLARNAALVLGNRRDASARSALERASTAHDSEDVREAARWALAQIAATGARS
jgi:epoxyqueuosine reductase